MDNQESSDIQDHLMANHYLQTLESIQVDNGAWSIANLVIVKDNQKTQIQSASRHE